jgi:hypothetical protein
MPPSFSNPLRRRRTRGAAAAWAAIAAAASGLLPWDPGRDRRTKEQEDRASRRLGGLYVAQVVG